MKKGDVVELKVESFAYEGKGIAKIDHPSETDMSDKKYVVFVHGGYPGDTVKAQIRKKKKNYAEAKVQEIITPTDDRTEAKCKYFGVCGGCKQQDLKYDVQLKYKYEQVTEIFQRLGGYEDAKLEEIVGSEDIFFYRNKMEYSFAQRRWLSQEEINSDSEISDQLFALGLHVPRVYDKVINIDECFLQSELSNKILNETYKFFKNLETSIYSTKTHEGYLRHLMIKQSHQFDEIMVNLVTHTDDEQLFTKYVEMLNKEIPEVTTIVNNVNTKKGQTSLGDFEKVYKGDGTIKDSIGDFSYNISANSFFQTNTKQAKFLYDIILDFAEFEKDDVVYDLYSGAGTISIYMANLVKQVVALESVEPAVKNAKSNSRNNEIKNIRFMQADLNKPIHHYLQKNDIPNPDVIVTDPPRNGMHTNTINDIIKFDPKKIVYVSCNPTTQVRDLNLLTAVGYKIKRIKPVDMFPHTYHIENVVLLTK